MRIPFQGGKEDIQTARWKYIFKERKQAFNFTLYKYPDIHMKTNNLSITKPLRKLKEV